MTSLSFQDPDRQRIKRIIEAIKRWNRSSWISTLSTGIKIKAREETPEKNLEEKRGRGQKKVELKAPCRGPQAHTTTCRPIGLEDGSRFPNAGREGALGRGAARGPGNGLAGTRDRLFCPAARPRRC